MKKFKLVIPLLVTIGLVALFALNSRADLSEAEARAHVKRGALIVDVRTIEEFQAKHLTNVVNIPLAEVKTKFPAMVTNKNDVVLLHCRTGRRSAMAVAELRALGYTNVFNLGSFQRAEKIVSGAGR
jgi:phage shock protein E